MELHLRMPPLLPQNVRSGCEPAPPHGCWPIGCGASPAKISWCAVPAAIVEIQRRVCITRGALCGVRFSS